MSAAPSVSPLAPKSTPTLPRIAGVKLGALEAGIRYKGRKDVMLAMLPAGAIIAGVLTKSKTASAPVEWCRKNLSRGKVRAILVNAGNANAFTGKAGDKSVEEATRAIAQAIGCPRNEVFMASTGVIGQPLDPAPFVAHAGALIKAAREDGWAEAAGSIMTTDTFPKVATRTCRIGDGTVTINGFAKGSGMIAPDMATMLGFAFTDAKIPPQVLQKLLSDATEKSFNCVTVDGDTSTSDTFLLASTAAARHPRIEEADDPALVDFRRALDELMIELAQLVARDGEGASKFVTINVTGATSNGAARKIGLSVANSPLVKTAIAGEDANWGRIVMAVGKSGEKADRDKLRISIGGVRITDGGQAVPNYDEGPVEKHIKGREVVIDIDLGLGRGKCTVWTCDLTHGYIDINGSYRS
ncbi:MAG: bifunctional glutamate N-acetyltransferase/amino-acid acetyltransferase ArgJ [Rhodospirillales bacterium]|nr:MAG: bifunctional glutamate N-acetyltransferase/amino-acid acetyltransferase ArgJ [Rhodospirillales bacterium]